MKTCANCNHSLDFSWFDRLDSADDGLSPHCRPCVAKNPALKRSKCKICGSSRMLHRFPGGDTRAPCFTCVPERAHLDDESCRAALALLRGALLRPGGAPRTITDILSDLGLHDVSKRTLNAAGAWLRRSGYPRKATAGCVGFRVLVGDQGAAHTEHPTPDVDQLLDSSGLVEGGALRTTTAILQGLGFTHPDRDAVIRAGAWLRARGFKEGAAVGRRGFRVIAMAGHPDNAFRQWAETYGALDALQLSAVDRDRYLRGTEPPVVVRLAMSALTAGLPPYT